MKDIDYTKELENFYKIRTETDQILLELKELSDFNKKPQKNLAKAQEESDEMFNKVFKKIEALNRNRRKQ